MDTKDFQAAGERCGAWRCLPRAPQLLLDGRGRWKWRVTIQEGKQITRTLGTLHRVGGSPLQQVCAEPGMSCRERLPLPVC